MDVVAVRGLLRDLVELDDEHPVARWRAILDRLPPYRIDADGSLAEWLWPGLTNNHAHRHASHLYGLWYDPDPDLLDDPALRAAAVAAVRHRLAWWREHGDEMAYGLTQLGLAAAALGLADEAYETVRHLAARYWRPSLVPTHNAGETFNIDVRWLPARPGGRHAGPLAGRPGRPAAGAARGLADRARSVVCCCGTACPCDHLAWSPGRVTVELASDRPRTIVVGLGPGPGSSAPSRAVTVEPDRAASGRVRVGCPLTFVGLIAKLNRTSPGRRRRTTMPYRPPLVPHETFVADPVDLPVRPPGRAGPLGAGPGRGALRRPARRSRSRARPPTASRSSSRSARPARA